MIVVKQDDKELSQDESELLSTGGLDAAAGIAICGSVELYRRILTVYGSGIEKKAVNIEQYAAQGDLTLYTIAVHALKSTSMAVGAQKLSRQAARLECYGSSGQLDKVISGTGRMLKLYRSLVQTLEPYCVTVAVAQDMDATDSELADKLSMMYDALDDFDLDAAKELMAFLWRCKLDERQILLRGRLASELEDLRYDRAMDVITEWRG